MPKGTIKTLTDRGFGFIKPESGEDLFFHSSALVEAEYNSLSQGREVEFENSQGPDGCSRAVKVKLAEIQIEDASGDAGDSGGDGGA